jgi:hypothetical protein
MDFLIQFLNGKNKELGRLQFWDGKKKGMTKELNFVMDGRRK